MDKEKLTKLFNELSQDPQIMAGGIDGGCDYRAQLISWRLRGMAGEIGKIWCWGEECPPNNEEQQKQNTNDSRRILFKESKGKIENYKNGIFYNFHVAATLQINKDTTLVFDPPYFDGPVTRGRWEQSFAPRMDSRKIVRMTHYNCVSFENVRDNIVLRGGMARHFLETRKARTKLSLLQKDKSYYIPPKPWGRSGWFHNVG